MSVGPAPETASAHVEFVAHGVMHTPAVVLQLQPLATMQTVPLGHGVFASQVSKFEQNALQPHTPEPPNLVKQKQFELVEQLLKLELQVPGCGQVGMQVDATLDEKLLSG